MKKWVILFFLCLMIIGCTRIKNEELVDFTGKNIEEINKENKNERQEEKYKKD